VTDDSYPPEWDDDRDDDPRYSGVPHLRRPTTAERALVADLVRRYVNSADDSFAAAFEHFIGDRDSDQRRAQVFLALLDQFALTAVGAQGEQLSVARAEGDLAAARDDIIEFGSQS
jgi:hypothetical protein